MAKALIAMSGGVDSSVAAYLMLQQGFDCIGGTMRLYEPPEKRGTCGSNQSVIDAQAVAQRLGIEHHVFSFSEEFAEKVIEKFVRCYECGLTPNPCIDCNRHLKFDALLEQALALEWETLIPKVTPLPQKSHLAIHCTSYPHNKSSKFRLNTGA